MSKVDELIKQLCPGGVEHKRIKDVFKRIKGTPITAGKMKEIQSENGDIRVFAGGRTVVNAKEIDIPNANITRVPAVLVQSRGIIDVVYFEKPFTFKNEMWAYSHKEKATVKYLYYYLKNNIKFFRDSASGMGSLPQISLPTTEDFQIPIPPLGIQEEIVNILDKFTTLEAELEAELEARKKQYTFYRDYLLSFEGKDVEWKTLREVCNVYTGGEAPENSIKGENATDKYKYPIYGNGIEVYGFTDTYRIDKDAVTISSIGANTGAIYYRDAYFTPIIRLKVVIPKNEDLISRYLFYFLSSITINSKKSSVPNMNADDVKKIKIPIPTLAEQQRIVIILDKFDALANDISIGLPAEIEARKKEYEYYRNQLLTFNFLSNE